MIEPPCRKPWLSYEHLSLTALNPSFAVGASAGPTGAWAFGCMAVVQEGLEGKGLKLLTDVCGAAVYLGAPSPALTRPRGGIPR